ncbi:MAG: hypothetical protein AB1772_13145 [Candidatus Zixiibacteriota bacterium]
MSFFRGEPPIDDPSFQPLPEDEMAVLDKAAKWFVKWGAAGTVAGIMIGESVKPANFIISQALIFFEPMAQIVFNPQEYATFYRALEKRQSVEILLQKIEAYDAVAKQRERAVKAWYKIEKRKWKWYQRYLGIFPPKTDPPEWVKNPPSDADELDKIITQYKNDPRHFTR